MAISKVHHELQICDCVTNRAAQSLSVTSDAEQCVVFLIYVIGRGCQSGGVLAVYQPSCAVSVGNQIYFGTA